MPASRIASARTRCLRRQRKKFKFTELQVELQKLTKEDRETRRQRSALSAARTELQVPHCIRQRPPLSDGKVHAPHHTFLWSLALRSEKRL